MQKISSSSTSSNDRALVQNTRMRMRTRIKRLVLLSFFVTFGPGFIIVAFQVWIFVLPSTSLSSLCHSWFPYCMNVMLQCRIQILVFTLSYHIFRSLCLIYWRLIFAVLCSWASKYPVFICSFSVCPFFFSFSVSLSLGVSVSVSVYENGACIQPPQCSLSHVLILSLLFFFSRLILLLQSCVCLCMLLPFCVAYKCRKVYGVLRFGNWICFSLICWYSYNFG